MKENKLPEALFPVKEEAVYHKIKNCYKKVPSHRAIVNQHTNNVISIVSDSYKLITNQRALEFGRQCMKDLFDIKNDSEINLFNIHFPNTQSFCHIDLTAESGKFKIVKDDFIQFVRITNSYNRSFRLSFKVGFCRWICKNGVIFDNDTIEFGYLHNRLFNEEINFKTKKDEFKYLKDKFITDVEYISKQKIDCKYLFPLFCKALGLKLIRNGNGKDDEARPKLEEKLQRLSSYFWNTYKRYSDQLGDSLYTLFNVITDYSSHPSKINKSYSVTYNSNQRKAGNWLFDFTREYRLGLNLNEYLSEYSVIL